MSGRKKGIEAVKTSELIKKLKKAGCYLVEHGKEHDKWHSPITITTRRKTDMSRYVYPAIITHEENGMYSVDFPDLEGCYTCGEDLAEALYMAEDVLAFTLYDYEKEKRSIPAPSSRDALKTSNSDFVNMIACDTLEYQKKNNNKAVKKTLSIPEWLNEIALANNANFSQVLQEALMKKYHIV